MTKYILLMTIALITMTKMDAKHKPYATISKEKICEVIHYQGMIIRDLNAEVAELHDRVERLEQLLNYSYMEGDQNG